jgi:hypothetical protein
LVLGELYTESDFFPNVRDLGTLMGLSVAWFAGILGLFSWLGVRVYRRT